MFRPKLFTTLVWRRFLDDNIRLSFSRESTISVLPPSPSFVNDCEKSLILGFSRFQPSTTKTFPSRTRSESAERNAPWRIFFGMLKDQSRGCGPCALPPPFQSGERSDAMRARPVPFCFQSFLPEPDVSPRVFVAEVP